LTTMVFPLVFMIVLLSGHGFAGRSGLIALCSSGPG
jgi:hypothetical protein